MESIDRLRKYGARFNNSHDAWSGIGTEILEFADEIECEFKELTDERDLLKRQWGAGVDFDQRLEECADNREDVTLFGVEYTALPVDADGVPIHVGDVMEFTYDPPQDQPLFEVSGFGADGTLFYAPRGEVDPRKTTNASVVRHHAPTVEDVLREFGKRWDDPAHYAKGELVETFAAKLRLAGEDA